MADAIGERADGGARDERGEAAGPEHDPDGGRRIGAHVDALDHQRDVDVREQPAREEDEVRGKERAEARRADDHHDAFSSHAQDRSLRPGWDEGVAVPER